MLCTCLLIYDDQTFFPGVTVNFTKKTTFKTQLEGKNSKGRSVSFHFFRFYHGIILSKLSKVRFYDFFINWNDFVHLDYKR